MKKDKEKVLVLHGFASIGKPFYQEEQVEYITPTFDYTDIKGTLQKIDEIVKSEDIELIIGKSTGGWFAMKYYESISKDVDLFLINPLLEPHKHFKTGVYKNYYTDDKIVITNEVLEEYANNAIQYPFEFNGAVFLGKNDDVLNYREALEKLKPDLGFEIYEEGHRFSKEGTKKVNDWTKNFLFRISIIKGLTND